MSDTKVETQNESSSDSFAIDRILLGKQESVSVLPNSQDDQSEVKETVAETTEQKEAQEPSETKEEPNPLVPEETKPQAEGDPKEDESASDGKESESTEDGKTFSDSEKVSDEGEAKEEEEEVSVSFDMPDSPKADKDAEVSETSKDSEYYDPESPLEESDPKWKHEAFQRLKKDEGLSEDDKKVISDLPPSSWDSAREWNKSHKRFGQFRSEDYPVEQFLDHLDKQSPSRSSAMRMAVVKNMVGDTDSLVEFAESEPEIYGSLVVGLANSKPELLVKMVEAQGYHVSEEPAQSLDVDELRSLMEDTEEWGYLSGTELEEKIQQLITSAEKGKGKVSVEDVVSEQATEEKKESEAWGEADIQRIQKATDLTAELFEGWEGDIVSGVVSRGLVNPTEAEMQAKPVPSLLRRVAHNLAVHGVEGMLPSWKHALFDWGKGRDGFDSRHSEVLNLIKDVREDEAKSYSRSLAEYGYEFGRLRASIPAVKTLLKLADLEEKRMSEGTEEKESTETQRAETSPTGQGEQTVPSTSTGFLSDKVVLGR